MVLQASTFMTLSLARRTMNPQTVGDRAVAVRVLAPSRVHRANFAVGDPAERFLAPGAVQTTLFSQVRGWFKTEPSEIAVELDVKFCDRPQVTYLAQPRRVHKTRVSTCEAHNDSKSLWRVTCSSFE